MITKKKVSYLLALFLFHFVFNVFHQSNYYLLIETKISSNLPSSQLGARKRGRPQSLKVSNQKVLSTLAKKQNTMETKLDQVESQSEIKLELKVKDKPSNANKTLIKFTNKTTGKSAKGKKVRTVKEDAKETHFEFPESSKLMRCE